MGRLTLNPDGMDLANRSFSHPRKGVPGPEVVPTVGPNGRSRLLLPYPHAFDARGDAGDGGRPDVCPSGPVSMRSGDGPTRVGTQLTPRSDFRNSTDGLERGQGVLMKTIVM